MYLVNDLTAGDSFDHDIPDAAALADEYLRALVTATRNSGLPVTLSMDELSSSKGFSATRMECLIMAPTAQRLQKYVSAHFAEPSGANLRVGWYQLGGDKARGIGGTVFGSISRVDLDSVFSLLESIHQGPVADAIQYTADRAMPRGPQRGFFGA